MGANSKKKCWSKDVTEIFKWFLENYWSSNCVIPSNTAAAQGTTFAITDTKLYVSVLTLSIDDNAKLLQQFQSGF